MLTLKWLIHQWGSVTLLVTNDWNVKAILAMSLHGKSESISGSG